MSGGVLRGVTGTPNRRSGFSEPEQLRQTLQQCDVVGLDLASRDIDRSGPAPFEDHSLKELGIDLQHEVR